MSELITSVTVQSLTELLQDAGYRVNQSEQNGIVQLLSASQGVGYAVRFGNRAERDGEFLDFTGPVQTGYRALFGYTSSREYSFFDVKSLSGAVLVMSAVLYPYVYLACRSMFLMQGRAAADVARTLGSSPLRVFARIQVPMARPAIMIGLTLVMMETLNDIGAVEYLGVQTLTFSVYDTWLNRGSLAGAAQIACVMLIVVVGLLWIERQARKQQRRHQGPRGLRDRHGRGHRSVDRAIGIASEEFCRDRPAVDRHEWPVAALGVVMQVARDHFLAGARLAEDQHTGVGIGHLLHHLAHVLDRPAGADEAAEQIRLTMPTALAGLVVHLAIDLGAVQGVKQFAVAGRHFEGRKHSATLVFRQVNGRIIAHQQNRKELIPCRECL